MSLRKYHHMPIAANDVATDTRSVRQYKKLILTAILLKISQINLKMICIQKTEK